MPGSCRLDHTIVGHLGNLKSALYGGISNKWVTWGAEFFCAITALAPESTCVQPPARAGPLSASTAWSAPEMPSGGTPAGWLVGVSHGRALHATLVEPRRLPVVVIPATTFPIAPSIAIPVHGPPLEVDRRGRGDIRVGWVVVVANEGKASRDGRERRAQADCARKPSKHSCLAWTHSFPPWL